MDLPTALAPGQSGPMAYAQVIAQALAYWQNVVLGSAPPAPTPSTVASGGTVANGTYLMGYSVVSPAGGESAPAMVSQVTTGTGISTLTLTIPALPSWVTGWNFYCSQVGGTTLTRQNGSPIAVGTLSQTLTAPPSSGGANPLGSGAVGDAPTFGSVAANYIGDDSYSAANTAITLLTNEASRVANPSTYVGPIPNGP